MAGNGNTTADESIAGLEEKPELVVTDQPAPLAELDPERKALVEQLVEEIDIFDHHSILFFGSKLVIIGTQRRSLSKWQQSIIKKLPSPRTFVISKAMADDIAKMQIRSSILNIGIDTQKYKPFENRELLREKYHLPLEALPETIR